LAYVHIVIVVIFENV